MKLAVSFITMLVYASGLNAQDPISDLNWIDLTYPFSDKTLYWPNNKSGFTLDTLFEGKAQGGYYYSSYGICAPEHGGTHIDAPIHFAEGRKSVDQLSLGQLMGEAVVIDVSHRALQDRDYLITIEDVLEWEKKHGALDPDAIILFRTGYGKYYPDPKMYFGTELKGDEAIPHLHFPGISQDLALWLTKSRKVKAVGIDTPSIDYGQSKNFHAHQILLKENIPAFENVAYLDKLPARGIYLIALPMLIEGGSGGPVRIVAGVR
jgi:kynurenine formamidase